VHLQQDLKALNELLNESSAKELELTQEVESSASMVSESIGCIDAASNRPEIKSKIKRIKELESQITNSTEELVTVISSYKQCQAKLKTERCCHEKKISDLIAQIKYLNERVDQLLYNQTGCLPLTTGETNICAPIAFTSASASAPYVSPPAPEDHSEENRSPSPIMTSPDRGPEDNEGQQGRTLKEELMWADASYGSDMDYTEEADSTGSEMYGISDDMRETMDSHISVVRDGPSELLEMDIDVSKSLKRHLSSGTPLDPERRKTGPTISKRLAKNALHQVVPLQADGGHSKSDKHRRKRVELKLKRNRALLSQEALMARENSEQV
jgi:hypothetical protein